MADIVARVMALPSISVGGVVYVRRDALIRMLTEPRVGPSEFKTEAQDVEQAGLEGADSAEGHRTARSKRPASV